MHIRRRVLFGRTPAISEKLWGDRTKNKAAPMALQALNSLTLQVAKEHPRLQNYFAFLKTVYFLGESPRESLVLEKTWYFLFQDEIDVAETLPATSFKCNLLERVFPGQREFEKKILTFRSHKDFDNLTHI